MPAAPTTSRPKTPAQQVALWMRRAVSPKGQPGFLQALADGVLDPAMRNKSGETLLHVLAGTGAPAAYDAVLARLRHVPEVLSTTLAATTVWGGYTPLHVAVSTGDVHAVSALLAAGADPNVPTRHEGPALHLAAQRWHPAVVDALLAAGARVHATDEIAQHSVTALSKALYDIPKTPDERARLLEVMDRLIDAGVNPHWPDPGAGASNLTRAIGRPVGAVERLIRAGVDLNVRDGMGRTALIDACTVSVNEAPQVRADTHAGILALLNAGADATLVDTQGNSALHLVVRRDDHTLVQALLAAGADPRARNENGQTPMDRAMHGPHDEVHEQAVLALEMACSDPARAPRPRERSRL